jgi:pimeloyl-ACP methyl ester carboxylesterase
MAQRLELEDVTIAYEERAGSGGHVAIVLVHGLGGSFHSWWAQLAAGGERGHRTIAYDQRGAGLSSKPAGPYSVELWARDLVRVIDALDVERPLLVGHSVGCMTCLRWREEAGPVFTERVRLARAGRMDEIAATVVGTGLSERCRRDDPTLTGLFGNLIASNDPHAYAEWSAATAAGHMVAPERVACPVLACCGEHDPVTPPSFAQAVADAVPNGRTAVVDGAAHWCHLQAPEAVNEILLAFAHEIAT